MLEHAGYMVYIRLLGAMHLPLLTSQNVWPVVS